MPLTARLNLRLVGLAAGLAAGAALQPFEVRAQTLPCVAANGVRYDPAKLFDPAYECYPAKPTDCAPPETVCANHALLKLGNYAGVGKPANDYQDLIYSPHRGLWGQAYGSLDPDHQTPAGQNTIQAFNLITSFVTDYPVSAGGQDFGKFLRGRIVELDITTSGNDVVGEGPLVLVDHYITTANTVQGSLNRYMVDIGAAALIADEGKLEKRDFSASPMSLKQTPVSQVTFSAIVDQENPAYGLIAYHDVKSRRGDIQCQTSQLKPGDPLYAAHHCQFNEGPTAKAQTIADELRSAQAMYDAGGRANIVIKSSSTFDEVIAATRLFYNMTDAQARQFIKRYMWQPHPHASLNVNQIVQYIHDWLRNAPRSVQAWEMNIYWAGEETNKLFCVTGYNPNAAPYGSIVTQTFATLAAAQAAVSSGVCVRGYFYYNMLDYLRRETGNPAYFGFTPQQRAEGPISGNRANLWLLETASSAGTGDRYYRWQMLGSDPKYNMSDPVLLMNYPYVAYQIINGDRMDAVHQVIAKGLYPKWGVSGPAAGAAISSFETTSPEAERARRAPQAQARLGDEDER